MRGVICYYSGSGNTKLVCQYLAKKVGTEFDLVDVVRDASVDLASYDVVGLAASTDFWSMPQSFQTFMEGLPDQGGKPAFVLNTFGLQSGGTLRDLADLAASRGLTVIGGHSVRMPESYPPMIAIHMGFPGQPSRGVMRGLDAFIGDLATMLAALQRGERVDARPVHVGMLGAVAPSRARTTSRDDMGDKSVDVELCTECGICARRCPYGAITLSPKPVFDMDACRGCWRCFSQCPEHAIYTAKFRGGPYYPRPSEQARETLRGPR
jgi:ferredoxin